MRNRGTRGAYRTAPTTNPLRLARLRKGHTQAKAAKEIGIGRARLARIELGTLRPPVLPRFSWHGSAAETTIYNAYAAYITPPPPAPAPNRKAPAPAKAKPKAQAK